MNSLLQDVLRAQQLSPAVLLEPQVSDVLLLGAAGPLGAAVLEGLMSCRPARQTLHVATVEALTMTVRGVHELRIEGRGAWPRTGADAAVLVFDRPRFSHGREEAFWMPSPSDLLPVARWLHGSGVRSFVVVMPHAPSGLPEALKHGLAHLDEQAVAALGFEHLVFVRSAQRPRQGERGSGLQRLAGWMLSQMQWMVPQRERPVQPARVAAFVREALALLPQARPGVWVARPELVWDAVQTDALDHLVRRWLDLPPEARPAWDDGEAASPSL